MGRVRSGPVCGGAVLRVPCFANRAHASLISCTTGAVVRQAGTGRAVLGTVLADSAIKHGRRYGWRRSFIWA